MFEFAHVREELLGELAGLEEAVEALGANSPEFGRLHYFAAMIERLDRIRDGAAQSSLQRLATVCAIQTQAPFLSGEEVLEIHAARLENHLVLGEIDLALNCASELEALLPAAGERRANVLQALLQMGFNLHRFGRYAEALTFNERLLKLYAQASADRDTALILQRNRVENLYALGRVSEARGATEVLLADAKTEGNIQMQAISHVKLAVLAHEAADDLSAQAHFTAALCVAEPLDDASFLPELRQWIESLQAQWARTGSTQ